MKRTISIAKIHAVAPQRRPGYVDDVLAHSKQISDTHVEMLEKDYRRIRHMYSLKSSFGQLGTARETKGAGSELKALLSSMGIHASSTCSCNKMASKMDEWGPDESLNHIEEIVDVMQATAKKRGLPFFRLAGKTLVRIACHRARKKANRDKGGNDG